MKKLMTMIAAVATAFGLYAADTGCVSWTDFNPEGGFKVGPFTDVVNADTNATWTGLLETGDQNMIEEIDHPTTDVPAVFGEVEAGYSLKISTTLGHPISRNITTPLIGEDGNSYVDFQASLTVFEDAPEFGDAYNDAKIAIWLQEDLDGEEVKGTNLWVRAGYIGGEAKNYNCGSIEGLGEWNRVTVKAIRDVTDGSDKPGFVLFINKQVVTVPDGYDIGVVALTPQAKVWYDNSALFPSLQDTAGVKGLGFDGKGYVDNIAYTTTVPFNNAKDAEFYTLVGGDNVASFTADGKTWKEDDDPLQFVLPADGKIVSVTGITYDEGYFGNTTTNIEVDAAEEYTVGVAKEIKVNVLIDNVQTPFASMTDAIAAANFAGATISLAKDYDASSETLTINNEAGETVLDLAGKALTGTVTYATALTVKDSSGTNAGKIVPVEEANAIEVADLDAQTLPMLTIEGGTIDGAINAVDVANMTVKGGAYLWPDGDEFPYAAENPWTVGADTFKATWNDSTSYWTVAPVVLYTVTITEGTGTELSVKAGDEDVESGDKVEAGTELTINVAAIDGYKDAQVTVNGEVYTEETLPVNANVAIASSATACNYVAQIGTQKFESLGAAVAALQGGETIKMLSDYTCSIETEKIQISKNAVIDFGNHTLTITELGTNQEKFFEIQSGAEVTMSNGTFKVSGSASRAPAVTGTLNIYCNVISEDHSNSGLFDVYGGTINIYEGAQLNSCDEGIRFKDEDLTSTVNMYGGSFSCGNATRMFSNYKAGHKAIINLQGGELVCRIATAAFFGSNGTGTTEEWDVTFGAAKFSHNAVEQTTITGKILSKTPGYDLVPEGGQSTWYVFGKLTYAINVTVKDSIEGCTASANPATYQISDEAQTIELTAMPAENYKFKQWNVTGIEIVGNKFTIAANSIGDIAIEAEFEAAAPAEWPDPKDIPEGQTVAEAIPALAESPLANANAKSLVLWAKGVGSVSFADAASIKADAYLLNIANDGDVDAAKAAFKVTISFDAEGKPVIETLPKDHVYNELQLLGREDLTTGDWAAKKDGDQFFKAELKIPTK